MKLPLNDFIESIIVPIETNKYENAKLYVSIKGSLSGKSEPDGIDASDWGIEEGNFPGKWRIKKSSNNFQRGPWSANLALHSLHTLLFSNALFELLYEAEHDGDFEPLRYDHLFSYSNSSPRHFEDAPKYFEDAFNCLPAGVNTEKARIVNLVDGWNTKNSWQFSLDCLMRLLNYAEGEAESIENLPDVYYKAIEYAKAEHRWQEYNNDTELLTIEENYKNDVDLSSPLKSLQIKKIITTELQGWINKNYHLMHFNLGNAIIKLISGHRKWELTSDIRAQIALYERLKYQEIYEIPTILDESETSRRITYGLMKKELDWQVQHLLELIENK